MLNKRAYCWISLPLHILLAISALLCLPASAANAIDARGFINVHEFRKDVLRAAASPLPGECSFEGESEDEEYLATLESNKARQKYREQQRKQALAQAQEEDECQRKAARMERRHAKAMRRLNDKWLPLLKRATDLGDPVAEVVLRLCETAPLLDRTGIAADCSEAPEYKRYARHRLETIDFKPALYQYMQTDLNLSRNEALSRCGSGPDKQNKMCLIRANIERYERILAVMRTGYLSEAETHNTCLARDADPEIDALLEICEQRMLMTMALASYANYFYTFGSTNEVIPGAATLSFWRPALQKQKATPWRPWPFTLNRNDFSPFRNIDLVTGFNAELEGHVAAINENIANDLAKEPRWAALLLSRDGDTISEADATSIRGLRPNNPLHDRLAEQERANAALRALDYPALIHTLRSSRIESLQYHWGQPVLPMQQDDGYQRVAPNLWELERRTLDLPALAAAYRADKNAQKGDVLFRFNIMVVVNRKHTQSLPAPERQAIADFLVEALKDDADWVRTEAVWGLGFFGNASHLPAVRKQLEHPDPAVRMHAERTVRALERKR